MSTLLQVGAAGPGETEDMSWNSCKHSHTVVPIPRKRTTLHCFLHCCPMAQDNPQLAAGIALLPAELAGCIWTALGSGSDARKNLFATSRSLQTLVSPSVTSLEFKLRQASDQQFFRGLQPGVQPKRITVASGEYSMYDDEYGAYDAPGCHAALCQFISALSRSPHPNRLEHLTLKVCSWTGLGDTATSQTG
jgi:hypothetical protein